MCAIPAEKLFQKRILQMMGRVEEKKNFAENLEKKKSQQNPQKYFFKILF